MTFRERIVAFSVFVSPYVAMWALLTEILLLSPLLTHRHTHCPPDCFWTVFHSNKHPGKQKHASCRKKKPFTSGCSHFSLSRTNTRCVFYCGLSPSFLPLPQPGLTLQPCRCSFWASLLSPNRCDYSWIPPFLQTFRTSYFCFGVQCIVQSLGSCPPAVLLSITTQSMSPSLSRRISSLSAYSLHRVSTKCLKFSTCCLCPVAVLPVWKSQLWLGFCVLSSFSLDNFSFLLQKEIWNKYKAHSYST